MAISNPYALNTSSKYATHVVIRDLVGTHKTVLDVGCNEGYLGTICDQSNIFYGLEYSLEAGQIAKGRYSGVMHYDLNNLQELPWSLKYDVLIFADVLEHVLYPEQALKFFVATYLKPGGKVILSVPNIANWQIRLNLLLGKFNYTESGILDKTHLHFYTYKTARELLVKGNCTVKREYVGASLLGYLTAVLPFLKSWCATSIILESNPKLD
jgi:2-polyprenyl-3-methyl-5-hydroxy-6-metoxy-1,4-benzoquinol methylase